MISDVLSDARHNIDGYLKTSMYAKGNWSPADYALIESCLSVMRATQIMLDSPPSGIPSFNYPEGMPHIQDSE